jgi:hypothetical protein
MARRPGVGTIMYRVLIVLSSGLALAACSSTPDWLSLDALKPAPAMDSITFDSSPPGAEAKTSTGQTCQTPCSLSVPAGAPFNVTFSLPGHAPETEKVELVAMGDGSNRLQPNPVTVELTTAAPAPAKKPGPAKKRPAPAKKPTASAAPKAAQASAPAPAAAGGSPWPASQQPQR